MAVQRTTFTLNANVLGKQITYSVGLAQSVFAIGRIKGQNCQLLGTGFAVDNRRIATAGHVTGGDDRGLVICMPYIHSVEDYQDTSIGRPNYRNVTIAAYNPVTDVCILHCNSLIFELPYEISDADHAPTGTMVNSLGYPHATDGRMVLTQHRSYVGARVLIERYGITHKQIILNTQARPGQSGSPVFSEKNALAYAMILGAYRPAGARIDIVGIDPQSLNQTTHAVSAEYIMELL